ncbi:hypothetical protein BDZ85DRAFT_131653 [Elsinoe ampelina]|uniref:Uncharacterized protein n=1 Tax=Elsinoe ampelina TaxID=302913 RepID=A0A6A6GAK8_9PEZI|nr:hypothetical protein BDZ85DRAFT_131653 [Elsinoe ampelina]
MSHLPFLTVNPEDTKVNGGTIGADTTFGAQTTMPTVTASDLTTSDIRAMTSKTGRSRSRIPDYIAFPLAVIITLGTSAGLYSAAAELTGHELATISRRIDEPLEIGALVGWRVFELLVSWGAGFDYWDTASLFLLTNSPYYVLLPIFYSISPVSILLSLSIDLFSTVLPFFLLRSLNDYNDSVPSQSLTTSSTRLYIGLFSTIIYATTLYTSLQTFLPSYIIGNFDLIRTVEAAHALSLPILATACLPLGNAAKDFLFNPSTYNSRGTRVEEFDPQTATLGETFAWNVGLSGWGLREDVLVGRTVMLILLTIGNSLAKIWGTVEGAEILGAVGWGSVFAAAHGLAGVGIGYVGDV